jgi:uncharacterized protein YdeI (YjbR/CyaY-like superfamily)
MKTLYVKDRGEWREWLGKNGASCSEIWLVYYKKVSGKPRIPYADAVEEALCFGWIDGKTAKIDEECFGQRFTPRRPGSRWSPINLKRARKLIKDGRMTPAGMAAFDPSRKTEAQPTEFSADVDERFRNAAGAWKNFQQFPPFYRRMTAGWVGSAKKEKTRLKRLEKLIEFSARNEQIKFM